MTTETIIAIGGLLVALVGLITGFILQRDTKKIRDLDRINKKYKNRLAKALNAIKGYQLIEEDHAKAEKKDPAIFRREIRKNHASYFNSGFLAPGHIDELIQEMEDD